MNFGNWAMRLWESFGEVVGLGLSVYRQSDRKRTFAVDNNGLIYTGQNTLTAQFNVLPHTTSLVPVSLRTRSGNALNFVEMRSAQNSLVFYVDWLGNVPSTGHVHAATYVDVTGDTMTGDLTIEGNAAVNAIAKVASDTSVHVGIFAGRRARGTLTSLAGVQKGDYLARIAAQGYWAGPPVSVGSGANLIFVAAETWSGTGTRGTAMFVETTPAGSGAPVSRFSIQDSGQVGINKTTASAQLHVVASATSMVGLEVQGAASQTANLTEWTDSGSNVLAAVDNSGYFRKARLRREWYPSTAFYSIESSLGNWSGGTFPAAYHAIRLMDGTTGNWGLNQQIPVGFVQGSLSYSVHYVMASTWSGDCYFRIHQQPMRLGVVPTVTAERINNAITTVPNSLGTIGIAPLGAGANSIGANDVMRITLTRIGANASDTAAGDAYVLGMTMDYAADM